jgi:hypothetical protein
MSPSQKETKIQGDVNIAPTEELTNPGRRERRPNEEITKTRAT